MAVCTLYSRVLRARSCPSAVAAADSCCRTGTADSKFGMGIVDSGIDESVDTAVAASAVAVEHTN